jgi:hypothetical protein
MRSACVRGCVHQPRESRPLQGMALPGAQTDGPDGYGKYLQIAGTGSASSAVSAGGVRARVRASAGEHRASCFCGECLAGWAEHWRRAVAP